MRTLPVINHNEKDFDRICRAFKWQVPEYFNMGEAICDKQAGEMSKVAIFFEDDKGREQQLTFGALIQLSNKFANTLQNLGVDKGDRVSVILGQRPETVVSHIGIYKLGGIAVPLSVLFQKDALAYRLRNSEAKVVVVGQEDAFRIRELLPDLPNLRKVIVVGEAEEGEISFWGAIENASSEFLCFKSKSEDPAIIIYTSGTTGAPKGALHAHRALIGHFPGWELSHNFSPKKGDMFWTPADWAWGGGLFNGVIPCLRYGVPILAYRESKFDPEKALYMMNKYRVRNSFIWPTALKMMRQIKGIRSEYTNLKLRSLTSGGESVGAEVIKWVEEEFGVTINEIFGQTEVNLVVGNCSAIMKVKAGAMGKPYPGRIVDLVDEGGHPVRPGEPGEMVVKRPDPIMFLGYWRDEKATQEKFRGDWLTLGDVATRDEDGYFWFVGRKDDVISSGGYRIGPSEIEDCLLKHPAVAQAAAVGSPDETRGEIVKAFIGLAEGYAPTEELKKELQEQVKKNLAFYEYPREIEFIDQFPVTTTGKIRRLELKQMEIERKRKQ